MKLVLHGYWRSTTSYRTRIALNLKGQTYQQVTYDLRTGAAAGEIYRRINPQGLVPCLEVDGRFMTQSPAILEWLEDQFPDPALLPPGAADRAMVRSMASIVACDMHPLNNLRVLKAIKSRSAAASQTEVDAWAAEWLKSGFGALEAKIGEAGGRFAFSDEPTLADCYLLPQVYSARRFNFDMAPYPHVLKAIQSAEALAAVQAAHPDRQPDADRP